MASHLSNIFIKSLPPAAIVYGTSIQDRLPLHFESEVGSRWVTIDTPIFCTPAQSWCITLMVSGETLVATATPAINKDEPNDVATAAIARLRAIVGAIKEARPLPNHQELDDLLNRATASRGRPCNVQEWARRLAQDIADLND
jgi:hypothetical protein